MKTPDEIKKGLELCPKDECETCVYTVSWSCVDVLKTDALTYIQQLEAELEAVKRERDAIVERLRGACTLCKNNKPKNEDDLCFRCKWGYGCTSEDSWEFDGVYPENTEVQK